MNPLWWVKPLMIVALVAMLGAGFAMFVKHERGIGAAARDASYAKGVEDAAARAKALLDAKTFAVEKAHAQDLARTDQLVADSLVLRTERDRLRDKLRAPSPAVAGSAPEARSGADETPALRVVLDACIVRYEDVARDAGSLASQVIGLQDFILADQIEDLSQGSTPVGERLRAGLLSLAIQPTTGLPSLETVKEPHPWP